MAAFLLSGCGKADGAQKGNAGDGAKSQDTAAASTAAGEDKAVGGDKDSAAQRDAAAEVTGKHHVKIHIKDKGTIEVELDADHAPITVANFLKLAEDGFYDGLTFHRIIDGFMMQGGDPEGTGMGGSEETIKGEFSSNKVENPLGHTRGAISMARTMDKNSASSQFFIVHQDSPHLDGDYAVFGYVTEGMDIVDDICENTTGQDSNGMVPEENRPVIESIEVVD